VKLVFEWNRDGGYWSATCRADAVNSEGVSVISSLLMDSGGSPLLDTVEWIEEGIRRLDAASTQGNNVTNWSREDWGADIIGNKVKVYSLYDENYAEYLTTMEFRKALSEWRSFITSPPDEKSVREIEL
jgi:hypothetical protein